jgi:hypothetical protein
MAMLITTAMIERMARLELVIVAGNNELSGSIRITPLFADNTPGMCGERITLLTSPVVLRGFTSCGKCCQRGSSRQKKQRGKNRLPTSLGSAIAI